MLNEARSTLGRLLLPLALAAALGTPWQAPAATDARACPARTFDAFARLFADDVVVQRRFTRTPLTEQRLVDADPEPRAVTRQVQTPKYPILPGKVDRAQRGLSIQSIETDPAHPK